MLHHDGLHRGIGEESFQFWALPIQAAAIGSTTGKRWLCAYTNKRPNWASTSFLLSGGRPRPNPAGLRFFLPCHFDARLGAANLAEILVAVFFRLRGLEGLFGLRQRFLRPFHVDLIGALHGFRKNGHAIGEDFGEAPGRRETVQLST